MLVKDVASESGQICPTCEQYKTFAHFSFREDTKKYRSECKSCRNQRQQKYAKTESGKNVQYVADQKRNVKFKEKRKARSLLYRAVELKKVKPLPCFVCGSESEAHHPDYSRPLDVVWLCKTHHKEAHLIGA